MAAFYLRDSVSPEQQCIKDIPERFTIHGLWPQRKDSSPVHQGDAECNEKYYSAKQLDHCIDHIPERSTIHGLWPQRKDASPVNPRQTECNDNHFSTKNIENILKRKSFYTNLKEDWPNLYGHGQGQGAGDSELWSIEWNQHGICSDLQNDPLCYFKCA
ncbi:hypothetical protein V6N13_091545 [Hibiscus sabdariffa]